jgi:hypothetical protein
VPAQDSAQEELQVRQTAQRILAAHLQPPEGASSEEAQRRRPSSRRAFWPSISLDLTGTTLSTSTSRGYRSDRPGSTGRPSRATPGSRGPPSRAADFGLAAFQGNARAGTVLVVGPAALLHPRVPQPDGSLVYALLTGHPEREPGGLVFIAYLTGELRA